MSCCRPNRAAMPMRASSSNTLISHPAAVFSHAGGRPAARRTEERPADQECRDVHEPIDRDHQPPERAMHLQVGCSAASGQEIHNVGA